MIILPDIHGRSYWREPVRRFLGNEPIIFLGDYVDPYQYEGVYPSEAFLEFQDIVSLKKEHPDDVTLLLGNHDLHYIAPDLEGGRKDYERLEQIRSLIRDNTNLFRMAMEAEAGGRNILFTHAGVKQGWLEFEEDYLGKLSPEEVCPRLNEMWLDEEQRPTLLDILADVSYSRWGSQPYGSPVWNDVDDMTIDKAELPGYFQIFGHSQQEQDPVISKHFACLDCRKAFRITEKGMIESI